MLLLPSIRSPLLALARGRAALPLFQHPARVCQTRGLRQVLAPKLMPFIRRQKGRLPIPIGGSLKGTTLAFGDYGIRITGDAVRLKAKLLKTIYDQLRRNVKIVKGCQVYLRTFPDVPVSVKGNESRMGKGKGSFEFWATRCKTGRVVFEIGGGGIREELAREALRQAAFKMPCPVEFITRDTPPRLGRLLITPDGPVEAATYNPHRNVNASAATAG